MSCDRLRHRHSPHVSWCCPPAYDTAQSVYPPRLFRSRPAIYTVLGATLPAGISAATEQWAMATKVRALPCDTLTRALSCLRGRDALCAARACPAFARALRAELHVVVWRGALDELGLLLDGGVGALVERIELRCGMYALTEEGAREVRRACGRLRVLGFYGVQGGAGLRDGVLEAFCAPGLEEVRVEFCGGVSGGGVVRAVQACQGLRRLTCKYSGGLSDGDVVAIARTLGKSLVELDIECNLRVGDVAMRAVSACCPNLALLGVAGCENVSDAGLRAVADALGADMLALDLHGLPLVSDRGVYALAERCKKLEYLNLWRLGITSFAVCAVAETCGDALRVLVLGDSPDVEDEALFAVAEHCSILDKLEIPGLQVTDVGVAALLSNPWLRALSIDRCPRLTDATLSHLMHYGTLKELSAVELVGVSQRFVKALKDFGVWEKLTVDEVPLHGTGDGGEADGSDVGLFDADLEKADFVMSAPAKIRSLASSTFHTNGAGVVPLDAGPEDAGCFMSLPAKISSLSSSTLHADGTSVGLLDVGPEDGDLAVSPRANISSKTSPSLLAGGAGVGLLHAGPENEDLSCLRRRLYLRKRRHQYIRD